MDTTSYSPEFYQEHEQCRNSAFGRLFFCPEPTVLLRAAHASEERNCVARAFAARTYLVSAGITSAVVVTGYILDKNYRPMPHAWVSVRLEGKNWIVDNGANEFCSNGVCLQDEYVKGQ